MLKTYEARLGSLRERYYVRKLWAIFKPKLQKRGFKTEFVDEVFRRDDEIEDEFTASMWGLSGGLLVERRGGWRRRVSERKWVEDMQRRIENIRCFGSMWYSVGFTLMSLSKSNARLGHLIKLGPGEDIKKGKCAGVDGEAEKVEKVEEVVEKVKGVVEKVKEVEKVEIETETAKRERQWRRTVVAWCLDPVVMARRWE